MSATDKTTTKATAAAPVLPAGLPGASTRGDTDFPPLPRWPALRDPAPLFSIGQTVYAIPAGAALPELLQDLQNLVVGCAGILSCIAEELTSPGSEGPSNCATDAYYGALHMLAQCKGIVRVTQAMSEFPEQFNVGGAE